MCRYKLTSQGIGYTCDGQVDMSAARRRWSTPTYAANGQGEAHSVEHRGAYGAAVERVLDAFVVTEKAPLVGADLTQVKGCQRQTPCGRRDQEMLPLGEKKKENGGERTRRHNKASRSLESVNI